MSVLGSIATYFAGRGLDALLDPSERTRLDQVVDRAIKRTIQPLSESIDPDFTKHLHSLLYQLVTSGSLAPLEAAAASNLPTGDESFQLALEKRGLDATTLGVSAKELLADLEVRFIDELKLEARRSKSPLHNRVIVDGIDLLLASITGTVAISDLQIAIPFVSKPVLDELSAPHSVARQNIQQRFDDFLASDARILVVTGLSGTGKSVESAVAARRWDDTGWTSLVVRASGLNLADISHAVAARLTRPPSDTGNWRRVVVQPWESLSPDKPGLVVFVDALDAPQSDQRSHVINELVRLIHEIEHIPAGYVKLVVSCETTAWIQIRPLLPFWRRSWGDQDESVASFTIKDFSEAELDRALDAIGANEFRRVDRPRGTADPYVDAIREMLRHPGAFGLFARLRAGGGHIDPEAATTSDLADGLAQQQIASAATLCRKSSASVAALLVKIAQLAFKRRSTEFTLSIESLRREPFLSDIDFDSVDPASSVVAALADRGVIALSDDPVSPRSLAFRFRDVGVHFLSLHLERSARGVVGETLRTGLERRFGEAWRFPPLIDAIIAWANRLSR